MLDFKLHNFSSLSIKDLLDAREAYHLHLSHLDTVYATAIGRYLIRDTDPNSKDATHRSDPYTLGPRTLTNSSMKDWSWPCVLVFVRHWFSPAEIQAKPSLAAELVPSFLYLPDGRVVPTCVVTVDPDKGVPAMPKPPTFRSDLVGGGFPIRTDAQGKRHIASIGCLVTDGDTVYALTNRHVTGEAGRPIYAGFKDRRLGTSYPLQLGKRPFNEVYPGWPGDRVLANLDAGLIRIDDVTGWTAQIYGIGEMGELWDLNVDSFRLDAINRPVIGYGSVSGLMKGKILGLFYRYKSVGGVDYISDFVLGPRDAATPLNNYPGDSGTLWLLDDDDAPKNAAGARVLRPFGLEWGGQALLAPGGKVPVQLALGICLSTICRELDVEVIPDWNVGHTEYWGEWGHVKIGAYAPTCIDGAYPKLKAMMEANADNIGLDDRLLQTLQPHQSGTFAPLADVADLVWRFTHPTDESNHFADMDKPGADGKTLLDLFAASPSSVDPGVWNDYYTGIGEDRRGALPFRVWQIFDEMVDYASQGKLVEFVCAAGIVAHYVGDACQPLHVSQYHHGRDPADKQHAKVHSVYETTMTGKHGPDLIRMIPAAEIAPVAPVVANGKAKGRDAAVCVVQLMQRTVRRLPPLTIVDLFDSHTGRGQVETLWDELKEPTAECMQDGARTLARIWEAAWSAGSGEGKHEQGACDQGDLSHLYANPKFLPSYKLQDLTANAKGRLVPK
ncbi:hypothetical protein [Mesorhizobium australicum]|uniref:hypothetical protein n=1 Tax=Mesorhizobium australicum TaxID=536018 RepID=UPI00333DE139